MRVRLKGINQITKRLADGRTATYYYAWKGGPRLEGDPGSPEFVASYERAVKGRAPAEPGRLLAILNAYQASGEFKGLASRTQADYVRHIGAIERKFGRLPIAALADRRIRGLMLGWRDNLAKRSRRQADYAIVVLARVLSWAFGRGLTSANPMEKVGRLYKGSRADSVWMPEDEAAVLAVARPEMRAAFLLGINTAQRRGDLLRLPWSAYDGACIRLRQSKTGARVRVPVTGELKAMLDAMPRRSPLMLTSSTGRPWTGAGFASSWRKTLAKAGIDGLTFHDLRGTALTRLALAGCDAAELAAISGLSIGQVNAILDRHYISRRHLLGNEAIARLEHARRTDFPN